MPGEFDFEAASDAIGAELLGDAGEVDDSNLLDDGNVGAGPAPSPEPAPAPAPIAGAPPAPAPAPTPGMPPAPAPQDPLLTAPKTWKPEVAARWQEIPDWARAEIARREENFYSGLEQYRGAAEQGRQLSTVLAPFAQTMQQYGIDPFQQIGSLMRAHHTLALGTPQQKQALLAEMDRDYGLGLNLDPANAPYVDPAVAALQEQVQALQSTQTRAQQLQRQEHERRVRSEIETFAADPKNVYFDECADEIAAFIQQGKSLADAYAAAVWANPSTRAKEMARLQQEQQAAAEAAAREAAEKAKKANGGHRPVAKPGSPTAQRGSIDDTLATALAEIRGRSQ